MTILRVASVGRGAGAAAGAPADAKVSPLSSRAPHPPRASIALPVRPRRPRGAQNVDVNLLLAFSHKTGLRLAEVGFLLILIAGVWLVAAQVPQVRLHTIRTVVAGVLLATAGVLLIVATHWGHFG
jgi:hypothetical protein